VGASSRSAGKKYKDAVKWKQAEPMAKHVEELIVKECKASEFKDCDIVFSGLDADVAGDIGENSSFRRRSKEDLTDQAVLQRWNSSRLNW
jgi:aspartate-semialdehyde dehydrogenase